MKSINILSVDFDYFIGTTLDVRNNLFPNGFDNATEDELKQMWGDAYETHPSLTDIGVTQDFDTLKSILGDIEYFTVAPSHAQIKVLLDTIPLDTQINIWNIDFHHDMYCYFSKGEEYNCSTWLRRLIEDRPNTKAVWLRREDSDTRVIWGEVEIPHHIGIDVIKDIEFNWCFLCESPEWTPPHLHPIYTDLVKGLQIKG